jgi:hypothetical protein
MLDRLSSLMAGPGSPPPVTTARPADRWPTALGLVVAAGVAVLVLGLDVDIADAFGPGVAAMMSLYVTTYAIGRPRAVWLVLPASTALVLLLEGFGGVEAAAGWPVVMGLSWIWVLARGRANDQPWFTVETVGLVFFGGLTIAVALTDARLAGILAGLGWLTHGLWDAYHFATNRIVHRTWSELCAVTDIPVGTLLILVTLIR